MIFFIPPLFSLSFSILSSERFSSHLLYKNGYNRRCCSSLVQLVTLGSRVCVEIFVRSLRQCVSSNIFSCCFHSPDVFPDCVCVSSDGSGAQVHFLEFILGKKSDLLSSGSLWH